MDLDKLQKEFPAHLLPELVQGIQKAVNQSAKRYPLRLTMKDDEIRRRVAWCVSQSIALRQLHRWSIERISDTMPEALLGYLRDGYWNPPEGRMWVGDE